MEQPQEQHGSRSRAIHCPRSRLGCSEIFTAAYECVEYGDVWIYPEHGFTCTITARR